MGTIGAGDIFWVASFRVRFVDVFMIHSEDEVVLVRMGLLSVLERSGEDSERRSIVANCCAGKAWVLTLGYSRSCD